MKWKEQRCDVIICLLWLIRQADNYQYYTRYYDDGDWDEVVPVAWGNMFCGILMGRKT